MGLETDFTCILRDFVQFLEALNEVKLSTSLETIRDNLLSRSKATLLNLAIGPPSSPEPYLDMNAGKGLLLAKKKDNEIQEYINTDQDLELKANQDYYETFQEINNPKSEHCHSIEDEIEDSLENTLTTIYSSFSATQTRINCNKWGHLSRKSEKKMFPFIDPLRLCWVGLLGSYLLIYGSEKDSRPNAVVPIRGYRGRPAPSIDSKRSDSAFEIFCPGHKTLQFVAKSPEEMEEWVSIICETSTRENDNKIRLRESSLTETSQIEQKDRKNSESSVQEERYQDADFRPSRSKENLIRIQSSDKDANSEILLRDKPTKLLSSKEEFAENKTPPLPARIPRRLPSLPHEDVMSSFQPVDEPYDEDDIYHKIEDFRDATGYQNCMVAKKEDDRKKNEIKKNGYLDTYDDVTTEIHTQQIEDDLKRGEIQEAYDDVQPVPKKLFLPETETRKEQSIVDSPESYDDVKTISIELVSKPEQEMKENKLSGAAQIKASKKSFLDRMRNRSYIVKKEDKNKKRSSSSSSSISSEALPTYDDISGMVMNLPESKSLEIVEQCEYLCPPTPRPIYSIPPSVTSCSVEQLYDDIAGCQDKVVKETENTKNNSSNSSLNLKTTETEVSNINLEHEQSQMEFEYYQSPRSNRVLEVEDALYDDVALLMKFRAKPRESTVSNFEKVWSRFSSGKSKNSINEPEESTNLSSIPTDQGEARVNRFQKLVNKIENTMKSLPLSNSKSHSSSSVT